MNLSPPKKLTIRECGTIGQPSSTYKWVLKDFPDYCKDAGESIMSPMFTTGHNAQFKWRLQLYPYHYQDKSSNSISLYIVSENKYPVTASYTISVLKEATESRYNTKLTIKQRFNENDSWGFHKFISRQQLLEDSESKTLAIFCELYSVAFVNPADEILGNSNPFPNAYQLRILKNHGKMFESENSWDVTLVTDDGKQLHAHKAVLSSGSNVFWSMFEHDMKEKRDNLVEIKEVEHETLKELVRFIYSGNVENLDRVAQSLYVVADRYGVEDLMNLCVDYICQSLNTSNAIDCLSFAYQCNLVMLKNKAKRYIANNAGNVIAEPQFQALKNQETLMLFELFEEVVLNYKES